MSCREGFVSTVTITADEYNSLRDENNALKAMIRVVHAWDKNKLEVKVDAAHNQVVRNLFRSKINNFCLNNGIDTETITNSELEDLAVSMYATYTLKKPVKEMEAELFPEEKEEKVNLDE